MYSVPTMRLRSATSHSDSIMNRWRGQKMDAYRLSRASQATRQNIRESNQSIAARRMQISGKLVIFGIVGVALGAAGTSWWFRYVSTNSAARFWGEKNVRLIRDAPIVELYFWDRLPDAAFNSSFKEVSVESAGGRDISQLPGLTHLRNALLEDRSFRWPAEQALPGSWGWVLLFRTANRNQAAAIFITREWGLVSSWENTKRSVILSSKPIADGLSEMLADILKDPPWHSR